LPTCLGPRKNNPFAELKAHLTNSG
jgi:hypothetical protein